MRVYTVFVNDKKPFTVYLHLESKRSVKMHW